MLSVFTRETVCLCVCVQLRASWKQTFKLSSGDPIKCVNCIHNQPNFWELV